MGCSLLCGFLRGVRVCVCVSRAVGFGCLLGHNSCYVLHPVPPFAGSALAPCNAVIGAYPFPLSTSASILGFEPLRRVCMNVAACSSSVGIFGCSGTLWASKIYLALRRRACEEYSNSIALTPRPLLRLPGNISRGPPRQARTVFEGRALLQPAVPAAAPHKAGGGGGI